MHFNYMNIKLFTLFSYFQLHRALYNLLRCLLNNQRPHSGLQNVFSEQCVSKENRRGVGEKSSFTGWL